MFNGLKSHAKPVLTVSFAITMVLFSYPGLAHQNAQDQQHTYRHLKSGAPVRIQASQHIPVAATESAQIELTFSSKFSGPAQLQVWADEGLTHSLSEVIDLDFSGGEVTLPVTLSSAYEGRFYLYVSVSMSGLSRTVSYGQTFGDEKVVAQQLKAKRVSNNGVKRMKAIETIRAE